MMNGKQIIGIIIAVTSVLALSTSLISDIVGPQLAKSIAALSSLVTAVLGSVMASLTSQSSMVKEVAAMPGLEPLQVNKNANQTLAALAVDPANEKIESKAGSEARVQAIADSGEHT